MNIEVLTRQFEAMGARLAVDIFVPNAGWRSRARRVRLGAGQDFAIDVVPRDGGEVFVLTLRPQTLDTLDLLAVDVQPKRRHLLLLAKPAVRGAGDDKRKFLCGHDERHWFVAAVPDARGVARIDEAMESLKPPAARQAQRREGVRRKDWNRRVNAGFVRQGEWFFLPRPDFAPPHPDFVLRHEPIQRAGGKPHIVEDLYRDSGTTVYVHDRYPNGLTEKEYERLLFRRPEARKWAWSVMRRNPLVYARGKVRHPDHATIALPFWHVVVMSQEQRALNVAFLD